jgi:hypothetical protein
LISKPDRDFHLQIDLRFSIAIAIMTAIEKPIRINRDPIFIFKPDPDFCTKIDPRFRSQNRIAIEKNVHGKNYRRNIKPDRDFHLQIDLRFYDRNRDHDPD